MTGSWWDEASLPRVDVSRDGWIDMANATALDLLGIHASDLGARHFTLFVAPGSLEFDSFTEVVGEGFTTVMRPGD